MSTPKENLDFQDERLEDQDDDDLDVRAESSPADESTDDEKARAERMGWSDKDKFRGDPERWVDAKTFLEKGETMLPVLKERLRKQDQDLQGMRKELHQVVQNQGEFERQTRQRVETEFNERKRKAVEEADTAAYDEAHKEEEAWRKTQDNAPQAPAASPEVDPIYADWESENTWIKTDDELAEFANDMAGVIANRQPHLRGTARLLEMVTERTQRAYPDKFTNPNRSGRQDVEGSTGPTGKQGGGRKKSYSDLPTAAKAKCDQYVDRGWTTQKEYVADYFGDE